MLAGTLPAEWATEWTDVNFIALPGSKLQSSIPPSWFSGAAFGQKLQHLDLANTGVSGMPVCRHCTNSRSGFLKMSYWAASESSTNFDHTALQQLQPADYC